MASIQDMIMECTTFEHSKENYELLKESMELNLMAKYIGDQAYLMEHATQVAAMYESCSDFDDAFMEAVDGNTLNQICEEFMEKSNNFRENLKKKMTNLLHRFIMVLRKIGIYINKTDREAKKCVMLLNKVELDEDTIQQIIQNMNEIHHRKGCEFPVMPNQPFMSHIKLKTNATGTDVSMLRNDLAAALTSDYAIANVLVDMEKSRINSETIGAIDAKELLDVCNVLINDRGQGIHTAMERMTKAWVNAKTNGIRVYADSKIIDDIVQELKDVTDKITQVGEGMSMYVGAVGSATLDGARMAVSNAAMRSGKKENNEEDKSEPTSKASKLLRKIQDTAKSASNTAVDMLNNSHGAAGMDETIRSLFALLNSTIGYTMDVYVKLNGYRSAVVKMLLPILEKGGKMEKDTQSKKDDNQE